MYWGKKKLEIKNNDEEMIIIGNNDIIIQKNYLERDKSGIINYPFKSFDISNINSNIITGEIGEFNIKELEIFHLRINYFY